MSEETYRLLDLAAKASMLAFGLFGILVGAAIYRSFQKTIQRGRREDRQALLDEQKARLEDQKSRREDQKLRREELRKLTTLSNQLHKLALPAPPADTEPVDPRHEFPHQPPDVAAPKLGRNGHPNPAFLTTHQWFLMQAAQGDAGLVFFGDSITESWNENPTIWAAAFGKFRPLNFGIGGDRTQHVLWRIVNGELDAIRPRVAVVTIGTNNIFCDSASEIAVGIARIAEQIHARSPATKVLLMGILPRSEKPDFCRERVGEVNALLARLADGDRTHFLDLS